MDAIADIIVRGGWVMLPLLVLSVISLALSFERALFWITTHNAPRRARINPFTRALREGDADKARSVMKTDRSVYGKFSRALLNERDRPEAFAAATAASVESLRTAIERWSVTLSTIITAAPMLGILGTVTGIIRSFGALGETTTPDPARVASGISEALVTTALGLAIALITLFPYMIFRGQAERCLSRFEVMIASAETRK